MEWMYLIIVVFSILMGITLSKIFDLRKGLLIHVVFFFMMINVSIVLHYEFTPNSWDIWNYFFILFVPIFLSAIACFVSGSRN